MSEIDQQRIDDAQASAVEDCQPNARPPAAKTPSLPPETAAGGGRSIVNRTCGSCKNTKPWTTEYFSYRFGNRFHGLSKTCRACLDKYYNYRAKKPTKVVPRVLPRIKHYMPASPGRLCYWAQGGVDQ